MQRDFPTRIRTLRNRRGLTQRALARAVGVSAPSICHWEAGRARPRPQYVIALAEALGVPTIHLSKRGELRKGVMLPIANPTLKDAINEAKILIAELAGMEPARVTIALNY